MKFPVPYNTKQLKTFIGLAGYYRKFVPNFSSMAKPLLKADRQKCAIFMGKGTG
jgi:hypothetical protein